MDTKVEEKVIVASKSTAKDFVFALGRRKSSTAEVRIYKKDRDGSIVGL